MISTAAFQRVLYYTVAIIVERNEIIPFKINATLRVSFPFFTKVLLHVVASQ